MLCEFAIFAAQNRRVYGPYEALLWAKGKTKTPCSFSSSEKATSLKSTKKIAPSNGGGIRVALFFRKRVVVRVFFNKEMRQEDCLCQELWHGQAPFRSLMLGPWDCSF